MKKEYDLSQMKRRKNPYLKMLRKQVTLRMEPEIIDYFKKMSTRSGLPYQNLITLYLRHCMSEQHELSFRKL